MAKVFINETNLRNIGDAIREKNGSNQVYLPSEMAGAIEDIPTGITPTGTKSIATNGTHDVTEYAYADVDVPNSYTASDEGKVVDDGALVSQGSLTITENDTYDTTLISELIANISGGGGGAKNILGGTTDPTSADGTDGDIYIKYTVGEDMFGTPSSNNPSDGTITATSTYSSYSPYKAFGNQEGWGANGGSGTLTYTFSTNSFIPKVLSFVDYFDVSGGYLKANTFTFEGSNDGNTWDVLYTKSEAATEKDVVKTVNISANTSYSKFRFVVNGGSGYAGIKNIVLTAEGQGKPIDTVYLKVDGAWIILEDGDWDDVNTDSMPPARGEEF